MAVVAAGCSDGPTGGGEGEAGSTSGPMSETAAVSSGGSDTVTGNATDATGSTAAPTSGSTTTDTSETTVEVTTYEAQPMVVDVVMSAPGATEVELWHASDDGVVVSPAGGRDGEHRFRVRGLRPAVEHTLIYAVDGDEDEVTFTAADALPGHIGAFAIDSTALTPEPLYRMFDVLPIGGETAGLAVVDPTGFTRWYCGWETTIPLHIRPITGAKLLDDGTVAFLTGHTAYIISELGEIILEISDEDLGVLGLHHEILPLPNGNFLALSHSFRNVDYTEHGTLYVAGDMIVEFSTGGDVVWTWDTFDHLDPQRIRHGFFELGAIVNPETLELGNDWTHANGIAHDPADDSLVLSMRHQDWLVKIDHATGNVLWRLGDEGDFTLDGDLWFSHQHSPHWLDDGSLLLYDNGVGNPHVDDADEVSRALQYELDEDTWTATQLWTDQAEPFVSLVASDADPMPGGHVLILDTGVGPENPTQGRIREVEHTPEAANVWTLWGPPQHFLYRATVHDRLPGQPL